MPAADDAIQSALMAARVLKEALARHGAALTPEDMAALAEARQTIRAYITARRESEPPRSIEQAQGRIQAMLAEVVGGVPDWAACRPAAEELMRFACPVAKLRERVEAVVQRERESDAEWMPRNWGWVVTVVAEEARRAGKIHAGEVDPPPDPPQPIGRKPRVLTIRTGGRIVGMYRPGGMQMAYAA